MLAFVRESVDPIMRKDPYLMLCVGDSLVFTGQLPAGTPRDHPAVCGNGDRCFAFQLCKGTRFYAGLQLCGTCALPKAICAACTIFVCCHRDCTTICCSSCLDGMKERGLVRKTQIHAGRLANVLSTFFKIRHLAIEFISKSSLWRMMMYDKRLELGTFFARMWAAGAMKDIFNQMVMMKVAPNEPLGGNDLSVFTCDPEEWAFYLNAYFPEATGERIAGFVHDSKGIDAAYAALLPSAEEKQRRRSKKRAAEDVEAAPASKKATVVVDDGEDLFAGTYGGVEVSSSSSSSSAMEQSHELPIVDSIRSFVSQNVCSMVVGNSQKPGSSLTMTMMYAKEDGRAVVASKDEDALAATFYDPETGKVLEGVTSEALLPLSDYYWQEARCSLARELAKLGSELDGGVVHVGKVNTSGPQVEFGMRYMFVKESTVRVISCFHPCNAEEGFTTYHDLDSGDIVPGLTKDDVEDVGYFPGLGGSEFPCAKTAIVTDGRL